MLKPTPLNRTILELKCEEVIINIINDLALNRTILELK